MNINTSSKEAIAKQFQYLHSNAIVIFCVLMLSFVPKAIIAKEVSLTQSQINVLFNKANQAYAAGDYQEAISIWLKIVKQKEEKSARLATVYSNLASVYRHQGKSGAAVRYWQKSSQIYREIDRPSKLAATLTDTARAYNDLGQPRFSIPLLTEAIFIAKQEDLGLVQNVAYLALGNAYIIQKKYNLAIDAYKKSLENVVQTNKDLPTVVWNNLSKAYQQKALITRSKAIAAAAEGELSASKLWQQVKSDRTLAWQAAQKAVRIDENSQSLAQAEALIQMAKLDRDSSTESFNIVNDLQKAEAILSALPDSYHKVYALIDLGKLNNDSIAKSRVIFNSAVKIAQEINNPRVISFAAGAMGKHYESQQQYQQALYWTEKAQFAAQQAQVPDSLYQWDWQAARIYHATGKTELAIKAYERAIASLQSIRSSIAQTKGNSLLSFQSDIEPVYRSLIQLLLSNNSSQDNLQKALQTKDLLLLSELENFFEDDCFELEVYTEADRLSYLNKTNTVVVNTIILNDKIYLIWQFPNGKFKKYAVNIAQEKLEKLVTQWRFDLENRENDNYLSLSQQFYKLLFSSTIKSDLELIKPKNLIFVNDGILRNVPMAALHDGQKFLIEDYAVVNSLGLNIRSKQPNSTLEKALVFGLSAGTDQFPPIPYVKQEIKILSKLVDEKQFLNEKFDSNSFRQQIESSKSSLVHIATHGRFGGTTENSFLQAFQSQISLKELEETLNIHNTNFPNDPIQLLVLSACETAASNPRTTLGMSGVAVRAGVSNVLGSLWSVNDQQIVSLIDGFYSYWIRDGLSKSKALRQAQLDLIKSSNYHPSTWSSMILIQE